MTSQAILEWGCYVPARRLDGGSVAAVLGRPGPKAIRSVSAYDEDTITMGVEAARAALARSADIDVARLFFSTSMPPYLVKSCAGTVHAALGLPRTCSAIDAAGATRSGISALITALDSHRMTLLVASDMRVEPVGSPRELSGGDASVAMVVGPAESDRARAEVLAAASHTVEVLDRWQLPFERFGVCADERSTEALLASAAIGAAEEVADRAGFEFADITRVVVAAEHSRVAALVSRALGVGVVAGVPGLGAAGAAHAQLLLVDALENVAAGDVVLLLAVSDGADALLVRKGSLPDSAPTLRQLVSDTEEVGYPEYLRWRNLIEQDRGRRPALPAPAPAPTSRSTGWKYALHAGRCGECDTPALPATVVCRACGATGAMATYPIADEPAVVVSATTDWLAWTPVPPLKTAVVRFRSGGELRCELADVADGEVAPGTPVRMTFRVLRTTEGVHNYFWKAAPLRAATGTIRNATGLDAVSAGAQGENR
ncbi:hypothetical protein ACIHDR_38440 [Nocardia sp. NPDC052278]|uniref:hypothetical protein n=1 Tax=unclassified Nocardia TaxID=2637762 RepID=UPI00369F4C0A